MVEKVGRKNVGNGSMSVLKVSVPDRNAPLNRDSSLNGDSSNKNTGASPEDIWDFAQGACASGALGLAPDEPEVSHHKETFWKDLLPERLPSLRDLPF